ncbi:Ig-like domain-containing protein [Gynurincola endophyticus]|uniref:Ig-like domain-containing protein n=1 Tax=Gynurincola endophyticus TaxID=2479004 RepID=UPI000F8E9159|nr:Ig-like domain-containing protein [Gynurincola endophyticus]
MKRNFTLLFSIFLMLTSLSIQAQINENFNSRPGVSVYDVKGHLQNGCWVFSGVEMNATSPVEGDGSLVTTSSASNTFSSIYTPVLDVPGNITVTFTYRVDQAFAPGEKKIVSVYLTDDYFTYAGEPIQVMEISNPTVGQTYTANFSKFPVGSGGYRVLILVESVNGNTALNIDQVTTSAPLFYLTGCSASPVAVPDNIGGNNDRTATGDVSLNDYDPNGLGFTVYMIQNSVNGHVNLNTNGTFTFTPNPGFTGNSTTFTYQICNWGSPELCSEEVTVVINFPPGDGILPVSLINFQGSMKEDGKGVQLSWTTNFEQKSDYFDVERSFNGTEWTSVGKVQAAGNSSIVKKYVFNDELGKITMARNDLYYRLKQVDDDGKFSYTKILVVRVYNSKNINSIAVTPNPVKNDINVTIDMTEDAYGSFKVYNAAGVEVLRKSGKLKLGTQNITIENSSSLTPGLYFLEVIVNGKERMIVKLMKD